MLNSRQADQSGQGHAFSQLPTSTHPYHPTKETLFKDYIIQSTANNEITCELQTEPLLSALKSGTASPDITMKLAKRDNVAVFCFEMQVQVSGSFAFVPRRLKSNRSYRADRERKWTSRTTFA